MSVASLGRRAAAIPLERARLTSVAASVLAVGLGVLAAIAPILAIAGLIVIAGVVRMTQSGVFAVGAYVFVTYFEVLASQGPLSPVKVAGVLVVGFALVGVAVRARSRSRAAVGGSCSPVVLVAIAAYVLLSIASVAWMQSAMLWQLKVQMLLSNVVVGLGIVSLLRSATHVRIVAGVALASAAVTTLWGYAAHMTLAGRGIGGFADPNEYAAVLVASLALGYGAIAGATSRRAAAIGAVAVAVCFAGVLASQSRGGLIGLVAMSLVLLATARGRERTRLVGLAVIAVAATGGLLVSSAGAGLSERITAEHSSGRSNLWRIAIAEYRDHPVTGVGTGSFSVVAQRYLTPDHTGTGRVQERGEVAHNIYLETLAELGVVGAVALIVALFGTAWKLSGAIRAARARGDHRDAALGRGLLAALVGMLACDAFLSGQYQELLWVVVATSLAFVREREVTR